MKLDIIGQNTRYTTGQNNRYTTGQNTGFIRS